MRYYGAEVVISGPAGTGKSRACLEKLHCMAEHYPGFRGLILRQTRESLTESALVTFEQHVVSSRHSCLRGAQRSTRATYTYPNGSQIAVRGLRQGGADQAARVMSAEYDAVYVQEATELQESAWEAVTTRLRNGKMPYQQLLADCNPDRPTHWLKQRCDAGRTFLVESRHEDNPRLWNAQAGAWTAEGLKYIAVLDALTGPRKARLRHGRWVQAEGLVYDGWDSAVHLIDRFDIPAEWERFLAVDFGFTNPFVCGWFALDPDGRLYLYRQIYLTGRLVEDHAARIRLLSAAEPAPTAIVCDHDAEGRATLEKHLEMSTTAAIKGAGSQLAGIQNVAARLKPAGDGRPRLFVLRDGIDERDPRLEEDKKPCNTETEFDGYCWDESAGRRKGDTPVKRDDHGMDMIRYATTFADAGAGGFHPSIGPPSESLLYNAPRGVWLAEPGEDDDGYADDR